METENKKSAHSTNRCFKSLTKLLLSRICLNINVSDKQFLHHSSAHVTSMMLNIYSTVLVY